MDTGSVALTPDSQARAAGLTYRSNAVLLMLCTKHWALLSQSRQLTAGGGGGSVGHS